MNSPFKELSFQVTTLFLFLFLGVLLFKACFSRISFFYTLHSLSLRFFYICVFYSAVSSSFENAYTYSLLNLMSFTHCELCSLLFCNFQNSGLSSMGIFFFLYNLGFEESSTVAYLFIYYLVFVFLWVAEWYCHQWGHIFILTF